MAAPIDPKLDLTLVLDDLKAPIDFGGHRSNVKGQGHSVKKVKFQLLLIYTLFVKQESLNFNRRSVEVKVE